MTGKDKTEDQLLSSIRKNKPAGTAAPRKKVARKAAPRKSATPQRKPRAQKTSPAAGTYQFGRRVWPD